MKMKQISDSTIKITIQLEDLEERGMEIADFLVPQEKTEEFFYAILDELEMPESFLDSGMLSFRVTPKPDKLDVFVTKSKIDQQLDFDDLSELPDMEELSHMTPDEFIKTLEKTISDKTKGDAEAIHHIEQEELRDNQENKEVSELPASQYIYFILHFSTLQQVMDFAKTVTYSVDTSELYKMESDYYLTVLVDTEHQPSQYPTWLLAIIREYADDSEVTRAVLQEHGHLLMVSGAIENLKKVASL